MKDYIKVGDVVRVKENIFINPGNSPRIDVGKKEAKVLHRTSIFAKLESLDGTYIIDEEDGSIDGDFWIPIEDLEKIEVEEHD